MKFLGLKLPEAWAAAKVEIRGRGGLFPLGAQGPGREVGHAGSS